jgi:ADP-ribose diphosphatase
LKINLAKINGIQPSQGFCFGDKMQSWKTLARDKVFDASPWLTVESHKVQLSDGRIIPNWPWIITPDYVNILPMTDDEKFLCFRQTKYAIEGMSLAPVGGFIEPNEDPLVAAKRELMEELGYAAEKWIALGHYRVDANRGSGIGHLFLALGVHQVHQPNADDLEEQELLQLSRAEIQMALANGEFKVLAWAANVALTLLYLK